MKFLLATLISATITTTAAAAATPSFREHATNTLDYVSLHKYLTVTTSSAEAFTEEVSRHLSGKRRRLDMGEEPEHLPFVVCNFDDTILGNDRFEVREL